MVYLGSNASWLIMFDPDGLWCVTMTSKPAAMAPPGWLARQTVCLAAGREWMAHIDCRFDAGEIAKLAGADWGGRQVADHGRYA